MTPEQINRIDRVLAVKLMGWYKTFLLFDSDNWWWEKHGEVTAWYGGWSPTRNIAQALIVDSEMCKLKFTLTVHRGLDNVFIVFYDSRITKERFIGSGDTFELALTRAACAAREIDLEVKKDAF